MPSTLTTDLTITMYRYEVSAPLFVQHGTAQYGLLPLACTPPEEHCRQLRERESFAFTALSHRQVCEPLDEMREEMPGGCPAFAVATVVLLAR